MTKITAGGLEIKQVLVGINRYQYSELERICDKHSATRSEVVREAIDLWIRCYKIKHGEAVEDTDDGCSDSVDDES